MLISLLLCASFSHISYPKLILEQYDRMNQEVTGLGRALELHYIMLLLSVLCFYLSVLVFTAYSIYSSIFVTKSFTVR
jgi:hypothetical protein